MMKTITALLAALALTAPIATKAADTAAAQASLKKHGCLKCHSVSTDKDGPAFKKVAAKYKGHKEGGKTIAGELKAGKMTVDGKDVKHATFKGSDSDLKNVISYILSR
jgi:cytochrome c